MKGINKKVIILVVLLVTLVIFVYGFFFKGSSSSTTSTALVSSMASQGTTREQNAIGRELLASLNQLRSLILDTSIFEAASFRSLQSFNVELQPEITGRVNPFLPINLTERLAATTTRR